MVQYVITRQSKLFLVESVKERGQRRLILECPTEQEAIALRRSLQNQADAAELRAVTFAPRKVAH